MEQIAQKARLFAEQLLAQQNPIGAELFCRAAMQDGLDPAPLRGLLARAALEAGRGDLAVERAREVLADQPGDADAEEAVRLSVLLPPPADPTPPALMVIKAWGFGFWSDVDHVLGAILAAELAGRTPIVWWGPRSLYGTGEGNAWDQFFEPVSWGTMREAVRAGLSYYPGKWSAPTLRDDTLPRFTGAGARTHAALLIGRSEQVVVSEFHSQISLLRHWIPVRHALHGKSVEELYRQVIGRSLAPKQEIVDRVEAFASANFRGRRVIGAHVRGTDKTKEDPRLAEQTARQHEALEAMGATRTDTGVFLLTDSEGAVAEYRARYGDRLILTDAVRSASTTGVHYQGTADKRRLGVEVMVDAYLAARCDGFVGLGSSNVSAMISHLKKWAPGACALMGRSLHESYNWSIHVVPMQG